MTKPSTDELLTDGNGKKNPPIKYLAELSRALLERVGIRIA
jgi:hypothetical protein